MERKRGLDQLQKRDSCCGPVQVPTEEELVALRAMMEIKKEVKILKERIMKPQGEDDAHRERIAAQKRMDRLRTEWDEWEEKRKVEAKRRMILLGHEKPDSE